METALPWKNTLQGKVIFLLVLVGINQFAYPFTERGGLYLVFYEFLYASMFAAGIYIASDTRRHLLITASTAVIFLFFALWYAMDPVDKWKILATYLALIPFNLTVIRVLVKYIFEARQVTRDVLYAAISIFLLIGGAFVPVYGLLETLWPGSLIDNMASNGPVVWQQLVYFSYITLTTAGYGDILPVSWWARSVASLEAVIGVLYIAILIGRLVGVYRQGEGE